ncbi:MAG TPA: hypothetical protein VGV07_21840 [Devosia sp.]|uniref:hypothetical protein n=1 Tax=Devosia sp. TaxID=1871048 RepID=UPI002DDD6DB7|nr:hypothetical protein [Devosia sp.]HEV2517909.1 hypothetical protein [Devosia sp.]
MTEFEGADDFDYDDGHQEPSFEPYDLTAALLGLKMLGEDMYLSMQANNIGVVDNFLNDVESQTLQEMAAEDRTPTTAFFLQAQTQMWIFAVYELMRTWRQRASDMVKWHDNRLLDQMISKYRKPLRYKHYGREMFANQLQELKDDPAVVSALRADLLKTEQPFKWMELLRMTLAKHEVAKVPGSIAFAPGYGRISNWTGSIQYEISNDVAVFGTLSRRDIANSFRAVPTNPLPSESDMASFRQFLKDMNALEDPFESVVPTEAPDTAPDE